MFNSSDTLEKQSSQSRFLCSLMPRDRAALLSKCHFVRLPLHTVLYAPETRPQNAYILTAGLASVVTTMPDGATVEVGVIGNEGVTGSLHLLGPSIISTQCLMQLEGSGLVIPLAQLQTLFYDSAGIRQRLLEFVQAQTASLGQIAACHRLHFAEERLARWLLMVQDRVQSDQLDLTQEFLGDMLGSRRTTVTKAAGTLVDGGGIEFRRGRLRVLSRERLTASACSCYPIVEELHNDLYKAAQHTEGDGSF